MLFCNIITSSYLPILLITIAIIVNSLYNTLLFNQYRQQYMNTKNIQEQLSKEDIIIFRESTTDDKYDVVFTRINKNLYQQYSEINDYIKENPIEDISKNSLQFLAKTSDNNYYVLLDKLKKDSPFYEQNLLFIENNKLNLLSKRLTGQSIDSSKNFEELLDKYLYRTGVVTVAAAEIAGEFLKKSLDIFDKNGQQLLDKSNEKLSKTITDIRNNEQVNKTINQIKDKFKKFR